MYFDGKLSVSKIKILELFPRKHLHSTNHYVQSEVSYFKRYSSPLTHPSSHSGSQWGEYYYYNY